MNILTPESLRDNYVRLRFMGSDEAATAIILGHIRMALSVAKKYRYYNTEELVSEAFFGLVHGVSNIRNGALDKHAEPNVTAYLIVTMRGYIGRYLQKEKISRKMSRPKDFPVNTTPDLDLKELIGNLTKPEKQVLKLLVAGYNMTDIGKKVNYSRTHVKRIIDSVRNKLKDYK